MTTLRLGTRRSALAMAQSRWVATQLAALGVETEIVPISTFGDESIAHLTTIGGTGVFAAAIRQALLAGRIDLAVHSLKDLPVAPEPGLVVAAVPVRDDPRDALVARDGLTLGELPAGATVGTGSPRREAQLAALGLGLEVRPVRGNVDTRIQRVRGGDLDAVVLARAGLSRLGRLEEITETIDPLQMLPAPGQGALAVECREDDLALRASLAQLDDPDTRVCVVAERALLAALEAGCTAPIGALAEVVEGADGLELALRAFVGSVDGSVELRRSLTEPLPPAADGPSDPGDAGARPDVDHAEWVGRRLAAVLLEDGAAEIAALPSPATLPDGIPRPAPTVLAPSGAPTAPHPQTTEQVP